LLYYVRDFTKWSARDGRATPALKLEGLA